MNNFRYFPNSKKDIAKLYRFLGIKDKKELFEKILGDIPLISGDDLSDILSDGIDESSLWRLFLDIDSSIPPKNKAAVFSGGGIYNHFVPSVIDSLISRSEFYTPYTPYQPEVSQGTLFALFEFQSFIAEILGMDVVNASMYDGAESLAEAVLAALRLSSANRDMPATHSGDTVFVSEGVNPDYYSVIKTFTGGTGVKIEKIKLNGETGQTEISELKQKLSKGSGIGRVPAVVIQQPNYYGVIEDLESLEKIIHSTYNSNSSPESNTEYTQSYTPSFIVSSTEPYSFGIINPPGFYNADFFAGEGNSFGNYMNFGGPLLGLFAAKKEYVRQMPGRIVGKTKDGNNKDAYAFILSTREQHIRRGAATSNICTNSSLNAVRAAIYLALCSKSGFKDIALLNLKLAHILRDKLLNTGLFEPLYGGDFFNEFSLKFKANTNRHNKKLDNKTTASEFIEKMAARDIIAGIALSENAVLISATENIGLSDIEKYAKNAKEVLNG